MLARAFRRVLLIELAIYMALAWSLVRYAAWSWVGAGAAAIAVAVALRAVAHRGQPRARQQQPVADAFGQAIGQLGGQRLGRGSCQHRRSICVVRKPDTDWLCVRPSVLEL